MSKLKLGMIPAHTECPFKAQCKLPCAHKGVNHTCEYSCAAARWHDICGPKDKEDNKS
jgi:hypothetical protein